MRLVRWTPLRSMMSFRDEMDNLLEDLYGKVSTPGDGHEGDWFPPMDMSEDEND